MPPWKKMFAWAALGFLLFCIVNDPSGTGEQAARLINGTIKFVESVKVFFDGILNNTLG